MASTSGDSEYWDLVTSIFQEIMANQMRLAENEKFTMTAFPS